MGLYLAKRITRPVQLLAAGAREIGAGHLDHRIEPETHDEFGALVEAFNTMASGAGLQPAEARAVAARARAQEIEADARRATSRPSSSASPPASSASTPTARSASQPGGAAAARARRRRASARRPSGCSPRRSAAARALLHRRARRRGREAARPRRRRSRWSATAMSGTCGRDDPAAGGDGVAGAVLVFDDVTPLIRAQKVAAWRDVARRLAHEIKNPLTPIQLSAERLRRHFTGAAEPTRGWSTSAPRRSSPRSSRSRRWSTSSRSSPGCRRRRRCRPI